MFWELINMHISRVLESRVRKVVGCMTDNQLFVGLYRSSANQTLKMGTEPEDSANQRCRGCESLCYRIEPARDQWWNCFDIDASLANPFVTLYLHNLHLYPCTCLLKSQAYTFAVFFPLFRYACMTHVCISTQAPCLFSNLGGGTLLPPPNVAYMAFRIFSGPLGSPRAGFDHFTCVPSD